MSTTLIRWSPSSRPATTENPDPTPRLMEKLDSTQRVAAEFALPAATTTDYAPEKRREALIERLLQRSLSDDGLDWDALARVDKDGWGITDPE